MAHSTTIQGYIILYFAEVRQAFQLTLVEYNNFEAGEGTSKLETEFAHISHKIVRWVRVGNNLETRSQLGDLIGVCIFDLHSKPLKAPIIFSNVWNMPYPLSFPRGNPSPPSNYRVFQKFVPIFSSLKFHWLLKMPFVKPSMLLIIHFNIV